MMLRGSIRDIFAGLLALIVFSTLGAPLSGAEPHEDPETAVLVFDGVSLFRYYSASLDYVLRKEPAEVEARLNKIPFANIPRNLEGATKNFTASSINVTYMIIEIDEDLSKLRILVEQYRLDEAIQQAARISTRLSLANAEADRLEPAVVTIGRELQVQLASPDGELRRSYEEVLERIARIGQMLALYDDLLADLLMGTRQIEALLKLTDITLDELLETSGVTLEELLKPTDITLQVQPLVAFVGDYIRFEGVLTFKGKPLAEREIDILVNGSRYVTARTDANGHYEGRLQVPYWYVPELDLQALYYPQDKDVGLYLASLSPVRDLKVLFYQAELEVTLEDKAYPGLKTTVAGEFVYGKSPPPVERRVEIYFDNVLVAGVVVPEEFAREIEIDPEAGPGEHLITVSAAATGRYAPVDSSAVLKVTRATPVLELDIPGVVLVPGGIELSGKLYSEIGPLSGALIKIGLGESQVELVSPDDGTFDTRLGLGMGWGVIGSQDVVMRVTPDEPWHLPLYVTRPVMMVNVVNIAGIVAIITLLGIYLPGRLRRRFGVYPGRVRKVPVIPQPALAPAYSTKAIVTSSAGEGGQDGGEPRGQIFYGYRLIVRLIQGITRALVAPHQTLREFAYESSKALGPAAKYFIELTAMVEKLLYSRYEPTEKDSSDSKQLTESVEEGLKGEGV